MVNKDTHAPYEQEVMQKKKKKQNRELPKMNEKKKH